MANLHHQNTQSTTIAHQAMQWIWITMDLLFISDVATHASIRMELKVLVKSCRSYPFVKVLVLICYWYSTVQSKAVFFFCSMWWLWKEPVVVNCACIIGSEKNRIWCCLIISNLDILPGYKGYGDGVMDGLGLGAGNRLMSGNGSDGRTKSCRIRILYPPHVGLLVKVGRQLTPGSLPASAEACLASRPPGLDVVCVYPGDRIYVVAGVVACVMDMPEVMRNPRYALYSSLQMRQPGTLWRRMIGTRVLAVRLRTIIASSSETQCSCLRRPCLSLASSKRSQTRRRQQCVQDRLTALGSGAAPYYICRVGSCSNPLQYWGGFPDRG